MILFLRIIYNVLWLTFSGGILLNENSVTEKGNCSVIFNCWLENFYIKAPNWSDTCTMQSSSLTAKYREERCLQLLNEVRYVEQVNTSEQYELPSSQENKVFPLKIMSYNVLSQTLLEDHKYLYRNASPVTLKWEYRFPRILGEIMEHNPDIICLQEVQEDHIEHFFSKLEDLGFAGVFKKRSHTKVDGCAIYFKANLFRLIEKYEVEYSKIEHKALRRDNVGLIVRLFWWPSNRYVTVANTHLLYNPKRNDVRMAQISELISKLNSITDYGSNNDLIFLSGDLNSNPSSPVIKMINQGYVSSPIHQTYSQPLPSSNWRQRDEDVYSTNWRVRPDAKDTPQSSLQMCHHFQFKSIHTHSSENDSEATTFQDRWVTVDYIFYSSIDKKLLLHSRLRLPSTKECRKNIRKLPNYASPSDHLPLVATFHLSAD